MNKDTFNRMVGFRPESGTHHLFKPGRKLKRVSDGRILTIKYHTAEGIRFHEIEGLFKDLSYFDTNL